MRVLNLNFVIAVIAIVCVASMMISDPQMIAALSELVRAFSSLFAS